VHRIQAMLLSLLLNLLVLAGWIFAGVTIVQIFGEAQPGDQTPTFAMVLAMLIFLTIAMAVGNYLLAINAYFELQHVRRKQQEDILHAIGNPHFQHHS
jgi:riboflavin transporter FmnP